MDIEYGDYKVESKITGPYGSHMVEFITYREDMVNAVIKAIGMSKVMTKGCQMAITVIPNLVEEESLITPEDTLGAGC